MRTVVLTTTDPRFNLAAEEYFLAHSQEEIRMLWRNGRSVIIGKNQNAWAEVNVPYTEKEGIHVVRRLSGGGAVFHDPGNVNYTFITPYREGAGIDFARFTAPILALLSDWGIPAVLGGRNDILVEDRKISGNAQAVYRRPDGEAWQLHHGTILFGADLSSMTDALRVNPAKLSAKGVKSVRSRVANLRDFPGFPADLSVLDFIDRLVEGLSEDTPATGLTEEETAAIAALAREKYETWQWNFGASLPHTAESTRRFSFGTVTAALAAEGGAICSIRLYGDYFGVAPVSEVETALVGAPLRREALAERLSALPRPFGDYMAGAEAGDILSLLLGEDTDTPNP